MQYEKIRRLLTVAAIAVCVLAALPAAAQKAKLDVQANVSPEDVLYFEGTVTPKNLTPDGQLQVRNEVDVLVEYVEKGGKFRTLPNRVISTAGEAYRGNRLLEGERLEGRASTLVEISGQEMLDEDEDVPLVITGTVDLSGAQKFRIITRLRHQWAGTFPEVECFYDVAGPYPVKAGIARKRESKSLLSQAGRFLEHSASEIGKGVEEYGGQAASLLLAGGTNPVGILQALLLGEVQQQSGALGEALRFIGGAAGAGASTTNLEQVLSNGGPSGRNDLTTSLVQGLVARYGGDLTSGGIIGGGPQIGDAGDFEVTDLLIGAAVQQIEQELGGNLGLRNLRIDVDDDSAVITSQMPSLDGHGHLEPIIAYMLVDAALAAPWTEAVAAVFDSGSGGQLSISAPAEAARNLARGEIDVETFLQLARFADPDNPLLTSGGIAGSTGVPGSGGGAATLLPQSRLPTGWLASGTHAVDVADLDQIIPGLELSAHSISWGGIQVIQANSRPVTVVGLDLGEAGRALELMQMLGTLAGGEAGTNLLRLSTDPPLHAVQSGERTYLLQGDQKACAEVAQVLTTGGAMHASATPGIGLTGLFPGDATVPAPAPQQPRPASEPEPAAQPAPATPEPAQPQPEDTPAPPAPAPAPIVPGLPEGPASPPEAPEDPAAAPGFELPKEIALDGSGYLRKTYLCIVVEDGQPVELEGPLAAGSERLGVYLEIRGAPRSSMLEMELYRGGFSCGRRMMGVNGDRRTVAYFAPSGGFSPGNYWLEIRADDTLVSRMVFEVK